MGRATIKNIAQAAGVSSMTVSNVINGRKAKATPDTIKKIRGAIASLNYTPNMSARSLVSKTSKLVGVIIPFTENQNQLLLDNPFYAEMISGIESALRANGYYMMLSGSGEARMNVDALSHWNVDALILLGIYPEGFYQHLKVLNLPTLLVDSYIQDNHFYHLRLNDESAAYKATKYLLDNKHSSIALVTGVVRESGVIEQRVAGYKRALLEADIEFDPSLIFAGSVSFDWGTKAAGPILQNGDITAAFCTADLIAAGLLAGLHKTGCRIPDDISVMGFDNLSIAEMVYPALTTIDQNILKKGELAGDLITAILAKKPLVRQTVTEVQIIERSSVMRAKG